MSNKLDLPKYKRLAKYMQIVVKVFFIASIICIVAGFIMGITLALVPVSSLDILTDASGSLSLSIDNFLMFKVNPHDPTAEYLKPVLASLCLMVVTVGAILAIMFKQLELILSTIKNDKPFAPENSRRLSIIGATLMIGAFVKRIVETFAAYTVINTLKLINIDINFAPDTNMIIIGFVVLVLAGVFKYGSYLQNEYDSTV